MGRVVPSWRYQCSICSRRPYLPWKAFCHKKSLRELYTWVTEAAESQDQLPTRWICAEGSMLWQAEWKLRAVLVCGPQPSGTCWTWELGRNAESLSSLQNYEISICMLARSLQWLHAHLSPWNGVRYRREKGRERCTSSCPVSWKSHATHCPPVSVPKKEV